METIIIILFFLATISFALQLELMNKRWVSWAWLGVVVVYTFVMHHYAIEQSYTSFKETLSNATLMMDFVVLQIIEALGGILISIFLIRSHYNEPVKKFFKYFIYLPGIIVFPAIFYFETFAFLNIAGIDFMWLGFAIAIIIPAFIWLFKTMFTIGIPEFNLKLELKFIIHIIQLIGGVWLSVLLFRLPVHSASAQSDTLSATVVLLSCLIAGIAGGMLWYSIKLKRISRK